MSDGLRTIGGAEHVSVANCISDLIRHLVESHDMDLGELIGIIVCVLTDSVLLNERDPEHFLVDVIRDRVRRGPHNNMGRLDG